MFRELDNNYTLDTSLMSNSQSSPSHETVREKEICSENLLTPVCNVGNCAFVSNKVTGLGFLEVGVQNSIKTTGFVDVSLYSVFDVLRSVTGEVVCLSLHGTNASVEEEKLQSTSVVITFKDSQGPSGPLPSYSSHRILSYL